MNIDSTDFGRIVIDRKKCNDVLIVNNEILERDWGSGSHSISNGEAEKLLIMSEQENPHALAVEYRPQNI